MAVSAEVRAEAVAAVRAGRPATQVARDIGVSATTVTNWVKAAAPPEPTPEPETTPDPAARVVRPPAELTPVPPPPDIPPAPVADAGGVCPVCRPPQGVHPAATSFTCGHGHWELA